MALLRALSEPCFSVRSAADVQSVPSGDHYAREIVKLVLERLTGVSHLRQYAQDEAPHGGPKTLTVEEQRAAHLQYMLVVAHVIVAGYASYAESIIACPEKVDEFYRLMEQAIPNLRGLLAQLTDQAIAGLGVPTDWCAPRENEGPWTLVGEVKCNVSIFLGNLYSLVYELRHHPEKADAVLADIKEGRREFQNICRKIEARFREEVAVKQKAQPQR